MTGCVIIDALRTPFCRSDAELAKEHPADLGVRCVTALMARLSIGPESLDGIIAGNVGSPCDAANISRVIGLTAEWPQDLTAHTVARNCASGIEAVTTAIEKIRAGTGDAWMCVAVESMSQYPLIMGPKLTKFFQRLGKARGPLAMLKTMASFRFGTLKPRIALLEGLRDPTTNMMMGDTADLLARDYNLSRDIQDAFALRSHERALKARADGLFDDELIPYFTAKGAVTADTGPRDGQTIERLAKLRPVFDRHWGTVTVGNACGITDGAAALLVTSESFARENDLPILAKIVDFAWTGCDPRRMGLGPVLSSRTVLKRQQMTFADMDVVEINEAFAAQVLACLEAMKADGSVGVPSDEQLNRLGGAIALGHPVGATGGRLLLTVARQLRQLGARQGLATLCIGGGQGGAVILENPDA